MERAAENVRAAGDFVQTAMFLLKARGHRSDAADLAEKAGQPRVANVLKAAVSPATLSALPDYRLMASGFAAALQSHGLFDACLDQMRRVPLATATVGNVTIGAIAGIVEEQGVKVTSRLTLENGQLTPTKAASIVALTQELLRATPIEAQRIVSRELINCLRAGRGPEVFGRRSCGGDGFHELGKHGSRFSQRPRRLACFGYH